MTSQAEGIKVNTLQRIAKALEIHNMREATRDAYRDYVCACDTTGVLDTYTKKKLTELLDLEQALKEAK